MVTVMSWYMGGRLGTMKIYMLTINTDIGTINIDIWTMNTDHSGLEINLLNGLPTGLTGRKFDV